MKRTVHKFVKFFRTPWFPWFLAGMILVLALLHEIILPTWLISFNRAWQALFWSVIMLAVVLLFLLINRLVNFLEEHDQLLLERDALRTEVEKAKHQSEANYRQLEAVLEINQKFVEAGSEDEIVALVLNLSLEMSGAKGSSFVPLDEYGQPRAAVSRGELPMPVMNDWVEYLAAPSVRQRCEACEHHGNITTDATCPLLTGPIAGVMGMFCLPVQRGEREYGVLNLFLPNIERLDPQTQSFLRALIDAAALAMESVRLRHREMEALRQMQNVRERTDVGALLRHLLQDVQSSMESDFATLLLPKEQPGLVVHGNALQQARPFLEAVLNGVIAAGKPVLLGELSSDSRVDADVHSLMAAPLVDSDGSTLGALLVGNRRKGAFQQRQLALLQTIAGQVALVVQNAHLLAEVEYKTMIQERTRLAREIHDGLAQTLGFLKLQVAQMQNYLNRREYERLTNNVSIFYETISDAYQDARQSIDGLRISPYEMGLQGWLEQTAEEFEEVADIQLDIVEMDVHTDLPPEVQAQLIRIVQEALSNVRKHSGASQVRVSFRESGHEINLEVSDDGRGFSPKDVPGPSQHGLRGMRERSELIGADFQIISRRGNGTVVRVRLPLVNCSEEGEKQA